MKDYNFNKVYEKLLLEASDFTETYKNLVNAAAEELLFTLHDWSNTEADDMLNYVIPKELGGKADKTSTYRRVDKAIPDERKDEVLNWVKNRVSKLDMSKTKVEKLKSLKKEYDELSEYSKDAEESKTTREIVDLKAQYNKLNKEIDYIENNKNTPDKIKEYQDWKEKQSFLERIQNFAWKGLSKKYEEFDSKEELFKHIKNNDRLLNEIVEALANTSAMKNHNIDEKTIKRALTKKISTDLKSFLDNKYDELNQVNDKRKQLQKNTDHYEDAKKIKDRMNALKIEIDEIKDVVKDSRKIPKNLKTYLIKKQLSNDTDVVKLFDTYEKLQDKDKNLVNNLKAGEKVYFTDPRGTGFPFVEIDKDDPKYIFVKDPKDPTQEIRRHINGINKPMTFKDVEHHKGFKGGNLAEVYMSEIEDIKKKINKASISDSDRAKLKKTLNSNLYKRIKTLASQRGLLNTETVKTDKSFNELYGKKALDTFLRAFKSYYENDPAQLEGTEQEKTVYIGNRGGSGSRKPKTNDETGTFVPPARYKFQTGARFFAKNSDKLHTVIDTEYDPKADELILHSLNGKEIPVSDVDIKRTFKPRVGLKVVLLSKDKLKKQARALDPDEMKKPETELNDLEHLRLAGYSNAEIDDMSKKELANTVKELKKSYDTKTGVIDRIEGDEHFYLKNSSVRYHNQQIDKVKTFKITEHDIPTINLDSPLAQKLIKNKSTIKGKDGALYAKDEDKLYKIISKGQKKETEETEEKSKESDLQKKLQQTLKQREDKIEKIRDKENPTDKELKLLKQYDKEMSQKKLDDVQYRKHFTTRKEITKGDVKKFERPKEVQTSQKADERTLNKQRYNEIRSMLKELDRRRKLDKKLTNREDIESNKEKIKSLNNILKSYNDELNKRIDKSNDLKDKDDIESNSNKIKMLQAAFGGLKYE